MYLITKLKNMINKLMHDFNYEKLPQNYATTVHAVRFNILNVKHDEIDISSFIGISEQLKIGYGLAF